MARLIASFVLGCVLLATAYSAVAPLKPSVYFSTNVGSVEVGQQFSVTCELDHFDPQQEYYEVWLYAGVKQLARYHSYSKENLIFKENYR